MHYRREIDGLRTIAVLAVVFFHAKFSLFSGGFVGVDIFFVISGFLITSIILRDLADNTFSLKHFYERRIRRILPALYTIVFIVYIASYFFLLADEFFSLSKSMRYLVFFCSNIFFHRSINYFNPTAENEPLLHTWSLAVEEQFYFVFPLIILLVWKYAPRLIFPLLCTCFLAGFIGTEFFWAQSINAKFYLAPFRAFEFLLGAICAFICYHQSRGYGFRQAFWKQPCIMRLANIMGLALICYSITCFNPATPFPGKYTLIPIFGVALLLLFTQQKQHTTNKITLANCNQCIVTYLLAQPVMVKIGLLSYSVYLWHHPLFTFARLNSAQEPNTLTFIGLICLTFILAYLSWRFIEQPFRNKQKFSRKTIFKIAFFASALLFILAQMGQRTNGYIDRFTQEQQTLFFTKNDFPESLPKRFLEAEPNAPAKPVVAVIGDSQAQDFANIIFESKAFEGYTLRLKTIPWQCQINFDRCPDEYPPTYINAITKDADVIIFASVWEPWAIAELPKTLAQIERKESTELYFIGRKDLQNSYFFLRKYLSFSFTEKAAERLIFHVNAFIGDTLLELAVGREQFINLRQLLNPDNPYFGPLFTPEGLLLYPDSRHFTKDGSKYMAELIFTKTVLRKFAQLQF